MISDIIKQLLQYIIIELNKRDNIDTIKKNIIIPMINNSYYSLRSYIFFIMGFLGLQFIIILAILIILLKKN